MISTPYGLIKDDQLKRFYRIAGYELRGNDWVVLKDELDYWQLLNPNSLVDDKKWGKKKGWLPIRDFNFQYACFKTPKEVLTKNGKTKAFDVQAALDYAEEKLFDLDGRPKYLPPEIEKITCEEEGKSYDPKKKPKSYNKILQEEEEKFNQ